MLKMMNSIERIGQIIPKFKQQLIFLEEREKLFRQIDADQISSCDLTSSTSTIPKPSNWSSASNQSPPPVSMNSIPSDFTPPTNNTLTTITTINTSKSDQTTTGTNAPLSSFPDAYQVPPLPNEWVKLIDAGKLDCFGTHCHGRQILIDIVVHDLIENYDLL